MTKTLAIGTVYVRKAFKLEDVLIILNPIKIKFNFGILFQFYNLSVVYIVKK